MCPEIYVRGVARELGRSVPLEEAAGVATAPEVLARLRAAGFRECAVSDRPAMDLARAALAATLSSSGIAAGEATALLYATCSFWGEHGGEVSLDTLRRNVVERLGLDRAELCGVALAESGNLASALRVARNVLRDGRGPHVLLVTADRVPNRTGEYRAMPNASTINGDGAAACVVSTEPGPGFVLEAVAQSSNARMLTHRKGDGFRKYLDIVAGIRAAVRAVMEELGATAQDYAALVTNNYAPQTLVGFAEAIGVDRRRVFVDNVARYGHVFAADNLINALDLVEAGRLQPGERVLALSTGPLTWGAISLRRC